MKTRSHFFALLILVFPVIGCGSSASNEQNVNNDLRNAKVAGDVVINVDMPVVFAQTTEITSDIPLALNTALGFGSPAKVDVVSPTTMCSAAPTSSKSEEQQLATNQISDILQAWQSNAPSGMAAYLFLIHAEDFSRSTPIGMQSVKTCNCIFPDLVEQGKIELRVILASLSNVSESYARILCDSKGNCKIDDSPVETRTPIQPPVITPTPQPAAPCPVRAYECLKWVNTTIIRATSLRAAEARCSEEHPLSVCSCELVY